jgi:hypothetical protein
MRKIAVIGLVLLTAAAVGCGKKSQEGAAEQAAPAPAPAPAAQEAAPAPAPQPSDTMENHDQAAPASGNDQGMSHDSGNTE